MTGRFEARKQKILEQLDAPEGEYHDLSPKGSVDKPIRSLISEINAHEGIVTTSSCSGRISVFLEGRKTGKDDSGIEEVEESRAGPGGKGGGGAWLFISHERVLDAGNDGASTYLEKFGLKGGSSQEQGPPGVTSRFIHLKFEPMILHILSASTEHAQRILTAALSAGFRESGAVSLSTTKTGESTPMVAVRSTGYSFDSIIGYLDEEHGNIPLVDERYLKTLVAIANDRFKINEERIARFQTALKDVYERSGPQHKPDWEDADARRQRKREEGLARQQALQSQVAQASTVPEPTDGDAGSYDAALG